MNTKKWIHIYKKEKMSSSLSSTQKSEMAKIVYNEEIKEIENEIKKIEGNIERLVSLKKSLQESLKMFNSTDF